MNVPQLFHKLRFVADIEIAAAFCQKCSAPPINRRVTLCFIDFTASAAPVPTLAKNARMGHPSL
jgi:hypothetical protein